MVTAKTNYECLFEKNNGVEWVRTKGVERTLILYEQMYN